MDELTDIVAVMDKAACVLAAKGADLIANRLQEAATILSKRAADAGAVDEWRPIETAPRDGTKIIGCAIRQSGAPEHVGLYWASHPAQKRWTDGEWSVFLTHWVPAPPALATALGKSNG